MTFIELPLAGAFAIGLEPIRDERGFFARTWCRRELSARGLVSRVQQCSISYNARRGTLRGLHYQVAPFAETKVISCIAGAIYDVLVDVRADSPTYLQSHAERLDADARRALYVPEGIAHGFLTLTDGAVVSYMISAPYDAQSSRGLRWDDPRLNIHWPSPPSCVSERDRSFRLIEP